MAKLPDPFVADFGFVPDRLKLSGTGFESAFAAFVEREAAQGRRATIERLCESAKIADRILRRARNGEAALPRHQVLKLCELMGCEVGDIAENPGDAARKARLERIERDLAAWPVPLRQVTSWVRFAEDLAITRTLDFVYGDDVLDLVTAPVVQAFDDILRHTAEQSKTAKALAAAALKDAAADLANNGLHVLVGRYMGREDRSCDGDQAGIAIKRVMVVRIRREAADLAFTIDRRDEPRCTSEEEDMSVDDAEVVHRWLTWEGKDRLALWPESASDID